MGSSVILPPPGQPVTGPDPAFKSAALPNVVTFSVDRISPPGAVYVQRDDVLTFEITSSIVDTVTINWRQLLAPFPRGGQPDAQATPDPFQTAQSSNIIEPGQRVVSITGANLNAPNFVTVPLTEGYLLSITAVALNAFNRGQVFVRAFLNRGVFNLNAQTNFLLLFADYVTLFSAAAWPWGRIIDSTESSGFPSTATFANPAPTTDFVVTVPATHRWRVQSLSAVLTTSAAVGNRQVHSRVQDGVPNIVFDAPAPSVQAASLAVRYSFVPGLTSVAVIDGSTVVPLPPGLVLQQSGLTRIVSATTGILAGDQWSALAIGVEDYLAAV